CGVRWGGVFRGGACALVGWAGGLGDGACGGAGCCGAGWRLGACLSAPQGGGFGECRVLVSAGWAGGGYWGFAGGVGGDCGGDVGAVGVVALRRECGGVSTALRTMEP